MTTLDDLAGRLEQLGVRFITEYDLQLAIDEALTGGGWQVAREHKLGARARPDFLVSGDGETVAIEVKIDGGVSAVASQLGRYAASDTVTSVLLVTACARHRAVPREVAGKPVRVVLMRPA